MTDETLSPGTLMAAELAQQPEVLGRLVARHGGDREQVRALLPTAHAGTVLLARGSSDNVAVYGRYLIEMASRRPAGLAAPSVHTRYRAEVDYAGYLVVALSQSGATRRSCRRPRPCARRARLRYSSEVPMVFQDPFASINPVFRVSHGVLRSLKLHRPELSAKERQAEAARVFGVVGLDAAMLERYPHELSDTATRRTRSRATTTSGSCRRRRTCWTWPRAAAPARPPTTSSTVRCSRRPRPARR